MNKYVRKLFGVMFQSKQTQEIVHIEPQHSPTSPDEWCSYWQAKGSAWRTEPEIDTKRQKELARRRSIVPNVEQGIYPFGGMKLNRADVEWLLATHESEGMCGPVDWGDEKQRRRSGLDLRGSDLRHVDLHGLPLACLCGGLGGNEWRKGSLEQLNMAELHLESANLASAHLECSYLAGAHLEGANLIRSHLEKTDLYHAHLEGAYLYGAHLEGASLRRAFFDAATILNNIILGNEEFGVALLSDLHWSDTNLSVVNWAQVKALGDEHEAKQPTMWFGHVKNKSGRLRGYHRAVRANRQLATALQNQGLNEDATRFTYRAQILQRKVLWMQREYGKWLFSLMLAILAGYGYHMERILAAYLILVSAFALAYFVLGQYYSPHLSISQAFLESITAFHGRVFLELFSSDTPQIWITALEAIAGLVIEGVFIAMLAQRFFGK